MSNIRVNYLYRDYSNYKNHGEVVFSNPDDLSMEVISKKLQDNLVDGEFFFVSKWKLPDLHFEKWDDQSDHPFHEFISVEYTDDVATQSETISECISSIEFNTSTVINE